MKDKLQERLKELKAEFEAGQKMMADLREKQRNLQETLLRISGAIQVLEEELSADKDGTETKPLQATKNQQSSAELP